MKIALLNATALRSVLFATAVIGVAGHASAQTPPAQPVPDEACTPTSPDYNPNTGICDLPLEAEPTAEEAERRQADGSSPTTGDTIVVTGSRIRNPAVDNLEPTTSIDSRVVQEGNFTNIADAINELPNVRGSVTPAGAQGSYGQGVNFINTYGLGSNRTLTLINGRRFVTSNPATNFGNAAAGTQVDLNVVPDILFDRVELVSVGGAPVYGSDAIAGVVNVILRSRFDGFEVRGVSGITQEGDNARYNVSALAGREFFDGRLNLTFAASHDNVDGVVWNDRDFLRDNVGNVVNVTTAQALASRLAGFSHLNDGRLNTDIGFNDSTTDGFSPLVVSHMVGIPYLTTGGLITATNLACNVANQNINPASCFGIASPAALFFDTQGNLQPFNQGVLFGSNTSAALVGGDGSGVFQFNDFAQITSDLRRTILNGFLTFDVTDNIQLFGEATHFRSRADELVQQPTFNSSLFGASLSGPLTFMTTNPFLTPQARAELEARGVTLFQISRHSTDIADLTGYNETKINRGVAGLRGAFSLFGREMNFETFFNYGKAKTKEKGEDINAQNFINAVNVTTDGNGNIVCTTGPTRTGGSGFAAFGGSPIADPSCVPFNPLGWGRASQAARDYILEEFIDHTMQRQWSANANLGGTLFDIWGGPISFNIGYEHRDEKADFAPSDFRRLGRGRAVAITPLSGQYNLDEVFGEILLPIVSPHNNVPMIHGLKAYARGRYVHSTINGGFNSWAVGGSYAPIRDIETRGNYTRSFRHPAITELFLPVVNAFSAVPDLCSIQNRNLGPVPDIRARNCAAFLAAFPNATPDPANNATVPVQTGGNPGLENEQANSFTAGVILRPRFIPRLSLTADYVSITLNQPIASLTVAQVAGGCFDNSSFNASDPANGNAFCSLIKRHPAGTLNANGDPIGGQVINDPQNPAVRVGFVNGAQIKYRGIQGTANYSLPLDGIGLRGNFAISADVLHTMHRLVNITGVAPSPSHGLIGDPVFAGQLRLRYAEPKWGISTTFNYTGEQLFSRLNRTQGQPGQGADAREIDKLDDYVIVSGGLFFDPTERMRLTLTVANLFNRQGQDYMGVLLPASYVDLLGRRFAASARVRF